MRKNITLSAEESLIRRARERAARERRSLNEAFRAWLRRYAAEQTATRDYGEIMAKLRYARPGRRFTREEMNER